MLSRSKRKANTKTAKAQLARRAAYRKTLDRRRDKSRPA